jgi:uncharacterized protein YtpQ (UPF0354 family)
MAHPETGIGSTMRLRTPELYRISLAEKNAFPMKTLKPFLVFLATTLALTLQCGITGCSKQQVDASKYNAAQWTNSINAAGLAESEFVRLFALREAAQIPDCKVRISGARELTIKLQNGTELKQFLDNAWADARAASDRAEVCEKYMDALKQGAKDLVGPSTPPDTNSVVAVVRDQLFLGQMEKAGARSTNRIVTEPLVADLHVAYGRDSERGMAYLNESDRVRLGLGLPELRKVAMANLHRILDSPRRVGDGPVYMIVADGTYESSLLLADKLWESQASVVKGDIVAAVPARDVLMFTGSESPDGLEQLRKEVQKIHKEASHVISKTLLVRRNGRWEKFE